MGLFTKSYLDYTCSKSYKIYEGVVIYLLVLSSLWPGASLSLYTTPYTVLIDTHL